MAGRRPRKGLQFGHEEDALGGSDGRLCSFRSERFQHQRGAGAPLAGSSERPRSSESASKIQLFRNSQRDRRSEGLCRRAECAPACYPARSNPHCDSTSGATTGRHHRLPRPALRPIEIGWGGLSGRIRLLAGSIQSERPSAALSPRPDVVKPHKVDILPLPTLRDLQQIDHAEKA